MAARRPMDVEDFTDGEERHFPAADLDTSEPCRNPLDPSPYPEDDDEGVSFPSIFLPVSEGGASELADAELRHSWERLQSLIAKCLETDSTPGDTVSMVYEFYTTHIRANFTDAGEWTKKSIYHYIYRDSERQASEAIHGVNHTIEFLRAQLATRREDGTVKINVENTKLFLAATKVHAQLVDAKRKRDQR